MIPGHWITYVKGRGGKLSVRVSGDMRAFNRRGTVVRADLEVLPEDTGEGRRWSVRRRYQFQDGKRDSWGRRLGVFDNPEDAARELWNRAYRDLSLGRRLNKWDDIYAEGRFVVSSEWEKPRLILGRTSEKVYWCDADGLDAGLLTRFMREMDDSAAPRKDYVRATFDQLHAAGFTVETFHKSLLSAMAAKDRIEALFVSLDDISAQLPRPKEADECEAPCPDFLSP